MKRRTLIVAAGLLSSCGVVGAPVAPETIGVAPTIERQKKEHEAREATQREAAAAAEAEESDAAMRGQDEDLPPLRPVGTR
jgi:hypothetical protein